MGVLVLFSKQSLSPSDEALIHTITGTAPKVVLAAQAEEALIRSETLLRETFNAIPERGWNRNWSGVGATDR